MLSENQFVKKNHVNSGFDDEDYHAAVSRPNTSTTIDVIAQQLKFIACLKIMMEELSTLATGFEVDGGLLRYQVSNLDGDKVLMVNV